MDTNRVNTMSGARRGAAVALAAATVAVLAGCNLGLPQAQVDPTRTFVLSAPAAEAAAAARAADAPVVRLRGVEIPSYLRGRPLVVRRGENEVDYRDFARWGEPLDQGIARVLREELLNRGAVAAVQISGSRLGDGASPALELTVRVLACEGLADGNVAFRARWELTTPAGAEVGRGDFRATGIPWTRGNDASLAAGISRAVAGLAADIGGAVGKR